MVIVSDTRRLPLGMIVKVLKDMRLYAYYLVLLSRLVRARTPRVFMFNTPVHGNLGDQAIVYAESEYFKRQGKRCHFVEVQNDIWRGFSERVAGFVRREDAVCIHGGGNLGTLWPGEDDVNTDIISKFPDNEITVFPQTCYYDSTPEAKTRLKRNRAVYAAAKNMTVMLRDKASYDFFSKNFPEVKTVLHTDIVLSLQNVFRSKPERREGVLLCFRTDLEKVVSDSQIAEIKSLLNKNGVRYHETSTVINRRVTSYNRNRELSKKWREFAKSRLVITDRLHGMIFASITGTPCIALDNLSGKVSGTYALIEERGLVHFIQNFDELTPVILDVLGKVRRRVKYDER